METTCSVAPTLTTDTITETTALLYTSFNQPVTTVRDNQSIAGATHSKNVRIFSMTNAAGSNRLVWLEFPDGSKEMVSCRVVKQSNNAHRAARNFK